LIRLLAALACLAGAARASAEEVFVTDQQADQVAVFDPATGARLATISVPGHPAGIAMSADSTRAYVTSPDDPALTVIDTVDRKILRRVRLLGVAVTPAGKMVFVADWYASEVIAIDPDTGKTLRRIATGQSPSGLAVSADGKMLAVANRLDDSVSVIDAETLVPMAKIAVCAHPFGIAIDPRGQNAYAACVDSDAVAVIDVRTRRQSARIKVGRRPYVVALSGNIGYVTNELAGTVTAFSLATNTPIATAHVGENPEGIEASADGKRLYVANWDDDTMSVLDAATLATIRSFPAGDSPRAFGTFLR
jgi:YVTN family beta-propeller protein